MHGVRHVDRRRFLHGLMIGCLSAAVGCGPGGGASAPRSPEEVERIKQTTKDYMQAMKKARGPAGAHGGR